MRPALDVTSLPSDARARREFLELRAMPDTSKPRIRAELEARIARIEEESARCYVANEEQTYRWHLLAQRIKREL